MPGVLKASGFGSDVNAVNTTMDLPKKSVQDPKVNGSRHVNGTEPLTNGTYAGEAVTDLISTPQVSADTMETEQDMGLAPPEIEHLTQGYLPLSILISRLAQDTFLGLEEVINELAEMQPTPQPSNALPYLNGTSANQAAQITVQKKAKLWNFAQDRRAKFIKLLVLSQWSRQADAVSRVIDLNMWITTQKRFYEESGTWIGELRRQLETLKMPSPDLKTALEVLSTGKAASLPDLNYLPAEPLTPQQMLKGLRTINTLLSIRLNLHENVPDTMRDWSIASGRVTFRVHEEFELDLSIADENPSSQLYFIDFRFTFSPCLEAIPDGGIRNEIEGKVNDILRTEGLSGCFDFLHNLVLTHKISIMRQEASDMLRGRWSENLRVEVVHRSLVIQYWTRKAANKNWVEIGISSGRKKKKVPSKIPNTPYISYRWHRHGKEVDHPTIHLDLANISLESFLKRIIAAHTNHIMHETKQKLRKALIYSKKLLSIKHRASKREPGNCALSVEFTKSSMISVVQEPISGSFAILPPSENHSRWGQTLNKLNLPAAEIATELARMRCLDAQERIEARARFIGWEPVKTLKPSPEAIKRLFSLDAKQLSLFKIKFWARKWMLASTTGMTGDYWWLVETAEDTTTTNFTDPGLSRDSMLKKVYKISFQESTMIEPTYALMSNLEAAAAAMVSQIVDMHQLDKDRIRHEQSTKGQSNLPIQLPEIVIRLPDSVRCSRVRDSTQRQKKPWCNESARLTFLGRSRSRKSVVHAVTGSLIKRTSGISALTASYDSSVGFSQRTNRFAFRLQSQVGETLIPQLLERFSQIERLIHFLGIIERCQLQCETASLKQIVFTYAITPTAEPLRADISFAPDSSIRISFAKGNPHLRIQDILTTLLKQPSGFESVVELLRITLPLLQAFVSIEQPPETGTVNNNVTILTRAARWYRMIYHRPRVIFDISLKEKQEEAVWLTIVDAPEHHDAKSSKQNSSKSEQKSNETMEAWSKLCREKGKGWIGIKSGIVAQVDGIENLLFRINEMITGLGQLGAADPQGSPAHEHGGNTQTGERGNEVVILD